MGTPADIRILAIGGSTRPQSSSERALEVAAVAAESAGATVIRITGRDLMLPIYDTESPERTTAAQHLVDQARLADGVLVASPGYHGGISGMMKNALDYLEDLAGDNRPYLDGRAVGCIAVAYGWQATVSTLHQLRQVVHALRGWPTHLGGVVNAQLTKINVDGTSTDNATLEALQTIGRQVVQFARLTRQS
ncbi:MAG: NADPH-dependent FMN reductase [Actinomycetales bacterium]